MFSTDPQIYGPGVNLAGNAARTEAQLQKAAERLAALVIPPFTPASRRAIRAALTRCGGLTTTLGRLSSRWIVEHGRDFNAPDLPYFRALGDRLRDWQDATDRLRHILAAPPLPLSPPPAPAPGTPEAAAQLSMERFYERLQLALSPAVPILTEAGGISHGDIPLPMNRFRNLISGAARLLRAMDRAEPWSFLDVGCGAGLKLLAAQEVFDHVEGIEHNPARAARARSLNRTALRHRRQAEASPTPWLTGTLPMARAEVHTADALTFDGYDRFDVIYAYRPIADHALRAQMERRIIAGARPGTVLIMPYADFGLYGGAGGSTPIEGVLHLKPLPGQDVAALIERAGYVGPFRPIPRPGEDPRASFVAPLTQALRRWGHLE